MLPFAEIVLESSFVGAVCLGAAFSRASSSSAFLLCKWDHQQLLQRLVKWGSHEQGRRALGSSLHKWRVCGDMLDAFHTPLTNVALLGEHEIVDARAWPPA